MINAEHLRKTVITGLKKYTGITIIRANQNAEPPKYPYATYQITTFSTQNNGTYGEYDDGIARKTVRQIWSLTAYSDDYAEAITLANKMRDWLDYVGTVALSDKGIVVQSVGAVSDRSNVLTVDYEYRYGFDCTFPVFDEIAFPDNGTIETFSYGEDLNDKLEDRLDGVDNVKFSGNSEHSEEDELNELLEKRLGGET